MNRRTFLQVAGAALSASRARTIFGQAPAIVGSQAARPSTAFGATAGDVDGDSAIIWSRTDRPSRLVVDYSTTESFAKTNRIVGPAALEASDFTARVDLRALPTNQRIFYRVQFQS